MSDRVIRIPIPGSTVRVKAPVTVALRGGEIAIVSLEPANDGEISITNSGDGVLITFKKKPFEGEDIPTPTIKG